MTATKEWLVPEDQLHTAEGWRCPACGDIERTEFTLTINHGFSTTRGPGYWYDNHQVCYRWYTTLFRLGWYPRGWGPRKFVLEPGEVLTDDQWSRVRHSLNYSQWNLQPFDVDEAAVLVGKVIAEVVYAVLPADTEPEQMMDLMDQVESRCVEQVRMAIHSPSGLLLDPVRWVDLLTHSLLDEVGQG